jgi:hypothetical protein
MSWDGGSTLEARDRIGSFFLAALVAIGCAAVTLGDI